MIFRRPRPPVAPRPPRLAGLVLRGAECLGRLRVTIVVPARPKPGGRS